MKMKEEQKYIAGEDGEFLCECGMALCDDLFVRRGNTMATFFLLLSYSCHCEWWLRDSSSGVAYDIQVL